MSIIIDIIFCVVIFNAGLFIGMIYMEAKWNIAFNTYHKKVIELLSTLSDNKKETDANVKMVNMWGSKIKNGTDKE